MMVARTGDGLAYRSPADALTAGDITAARALDLVDWLAGQAGRGSERSDLLRAVAGCDALGQEDLTRLLAADGARAASVHGILLTHPVLSRLATVRSLASDPLSMKYLLTQPLVYAEPIIVGIGRHPSVKEGRWSHPLVTAAREALSGDVHTATVTALAASRDEATLCLLAASPLLDEIGWSLLTARLRDEPGLLDLLLPHLFARPDVTAARALPLLPLCKRKVVRQFVFQYLANNPACPVEAFLWMVRHRDRLVVQTALVAQGCPDEVRWEAVRRGHVHALIKAQGRVPAEVALAALSASDDAGDLGDQRGLGGSDAEQIAVRLAAVSDDPQVLGAVLAWFLLSGDPAVQADRFRRAVLAECEQISVSVKRDLALGVLAGHPDGRVRATVVPWLIDPVSLASAAGDESVVVREAVAGHPLLPAAMVRRLAGDVSAVVRVVVAGRYDLPHDLLGVFLGDGDDGVREVAGERFLTALTA